MALGGVALGGVALGGVALDGAALGGVTRFVWGLFQISVYVKSCISRSRKQRRVGVGGLTYPDERSLLK